jgi:hypothetical protein
MVATFDAGTTHAIRGKYRYDRTDNRTLCGRRVRAVESWHSGRMIDITCKSCGRTGDE